VIPDEASLDSAGRLDAPGQDPGRQPVQSACDIRLTLPARAENVALVRHMIGALAEAMHLPSELVEDVKLAVTEACTNVVRHAYDGSDGPLHVRVEPEEACLTVIVSDQGRGIRPKPESDGAGLGLPLIAALASQLEIDESPSEGSRVRMSFRPMGNLEPA
jgi:anti-sigma regulatory factor (Ser/Thr protein kinase)